MNRKYLIILAIAILTSISTVTAVLYYMQTLDAPLISLNSPLLITDMESNPITTLPATSLYISESSSLYFIAVNNYDNDLQVTVSTLFGGTGFQMQDSVIGIDLGSGFVSQDLDVPFTLTQGSSVTIGISITHFEPAVDPTLVVTILAE